MLKNLSKPMQYALIAVLGIAAWFILSPMLFPDTAPTTVKKPASSKTTKKGLVAYLPEDFSAQFDPIAAPLKNAFKPLIMKVVSPRGLAAQVNILPPEFAGGESNWIYTGSAEIDGVLQALLENKTSGDSVFLRVGDTWKGISVEEITDDSLVLASPETGMEKTLKIPTEEIPAGPGGFAPATLNAPLRGGIGPMSVQPDPTMGGNNGGFTNGGGFNNGGFNNGGFGNGGTGGGNGNGGNGGGGRRGGRGGGRNGGGGNGGG